MNTSQIDINTRKYRCLFLWNGQGEDGNVNNIIEIIPLVSIKMGKDDKFFSL